VIETTVTCDYCGTKLHQPHAFSQRDAEAKGWFFLLENGTDAPYLGPSDRWLACCSVRCYVESRHNAPDVVSP